MGNPQVCAAGISFPLLNYCIFIVYIVYYLFFSFLEILHSLFLLLSFYLTHQPTYFYLSSLVFSSPTTQKPLPEKAMAQLCSTHHWAEPGCMIENLQGLGGGTLLSYVPPAPHCSHFPSSWQLPYSQLSLPPSHPLSLYFNCLHLQLHYWLFKILCLTPQWASKAAHIILISSILSSQKPCEIRMHNWPKITQQASLAE